MKFSDGFYAIGNLHKKRLRVMIHRLLLAR